MASGTARTRRRRARHTGGTTSVADWIRQITPAGWVALGAGVIALALALQTLQGRSVDYDEGVYWESLRAMANGHPLFGSVFSSQPPLFLLSVYPFYMIFGQSLSAARLALVFFSLVGIAGMYVAGRALGHRNIGAVACVLLALDPLYQHSAHTLQAELPSIALQIWAVTCAALALRASGRRRDWLVVGAGVLLGGALLMKLFAIVALVPVALYLSAPPIRRWLDFDGKLRQPPGTTVLDGVLEIARPIGLMVAGLFVAVALVLLPFVNQLGVVYDQAVRFHLTAADVHSLSLGRNLRLIAKTLFNAPVIYTALLSAVVIVWRRMWVAAPLIVWTLADVVTLVRQQPLLQHHVVLLSPALVLIAGCGAYAAWQTFTAAQGKRLAQAITIIALVVAGVTGLVINWQNNARANTPEPTRSLRMALALQGVSAPDEIVLADDQHVAALANRDVPPQFVDTSAVRITSGYLTSAQLEDYITRNRVHVILFASGRFNLLPGFHAWVAQRYTQVAAFDHGGALYLLEPISNPPV